MISFILIVKCYFSKFLARQKLFIKMPLSYICIAFSCKHGEKSSVGELRDV